MATMQLTTNGAIKYFTSFPMCIDRSIETLLLMLMDIISYLM